MFDVRSIAQRLPHHVARAALLVLTLCCLQAAVMRWGPRRMNLVTAGKGEVYVRSFAVSADRQLALTQISMARLPMQPYDRVLFIHQTEGSRDPQRLLPNRTDVRCAAMTRDGARVAVATEDGLVQIFAPGLPEVTATRLDHIAPDLIHRLRWTNDGRKLVALGSDFFYVWQYPECRRLHKLENSRKGALRLELAADSETLLLFHLGHYDVWSLATGRQVNSVEFARQVHDVALSTDSRLAALAFDRGLCVWDLQLGREVWRRAAPVYGEAWRSIAISPDDTLVASIYPIGDAASRIVVMRLSDGESIATFDSAVGNVTEAAFVSQTQLWICGYRGVMEGREIPSGRELWHHDFAALH